MRPLPVELINFDAAWNGKTPVLTWATASEKNSAYFDIERSLDGATFEKVGQRQGAGNSSTRINYQFADVSLTVANATVYYRLRQVDTDGTTAFSPVRSLKTGAVSQAFQAGVLPNPYDKTVSVQFNSLSTAAVTLTVRNVLGQTVLTKTVSTAEGVQEVELSEAGSLPRGLYYLTVRQGNQQQVVRMSHQ
ncbi:T9SS type A sorting domain-containing protein [Hymenobacter humi]|uniref:T9SS type A sorting domain-containing protein n=1 Tax=Hymenobacter humi TaxID=1411620 RepID=A0ABW2U250_9BACT